MRTKLTKIIAWLFTVVVVASTYVVYNVWVEKTEVNANPDYICVKDVNESCEISHCWPWNPSTHSRTCYWTRVTKVAYYHLRTSCESWYYSVWVRADIGGDSWRHSEDFTYATSSCSITEYDTQAPSGETSINQ